MLLYNTFRIIGIIINKLKVGEKMKTKKLLIASFVVLGILSVNSKVFAANLQAQVQKAGAHSSRAAVQKSYPEIAKLIEYNNYAEADAKIAALLEKNPNDINAVSLNAISKAKQYMLAPAQVEVDKWIKKYPNKPELHYAQAIIYINRQTSSDVDYIKNTRGLLNSAIKECVKAVNLNSKYYEAYNAMGVATMKLGNKSDARDLFKMSARINPNFATAYDNLGVVELTDENLDGAQRYFEKALRCNSHNPTSMYHMAQVEAKRGNLSAALTWLNHSLHINPNSAPAWNLQGELYLKQGNEPAALNSFRKAVLVKPEYSRPYVNLANVYESRADSEFAIEQLKTAIAINPNYQEGKLRIADLSLGCRKYEQALDFYGRILDDPQYSKEATVGLANTYYEMSKDRADSGNMTTNKELYLAYEYINKAIEKMPNDLELHLAKLKLASLTHQEPLAKDSLNYIVQSAGNNLMDSVIKGEAYLVLGREKDAVYTFENAVNFADNVDDELLLAEILVHEKQFRTARTALKKALMSDPNNMIAKNGIAYIDLCEIKSVEFFDVAKHQFKEGNYASTIEYCNRAIDFYHNSADIAKLKAMAYEKEENAQGAIKYYTQYLVMNPNAADRAEITNRINRMRGVPTQQAPATSSKDKKKSKR